ncbi:MAG: hypothetical protein JNK34_08590, partial [Tabrizicola sp.]|nr:hypothetical protein [Tabrizicola sp.]
MFRPLSPLAVAATALSLLADPGMTWAQEVMLDLTGPDESKTEARDSEVLLLPEERMELQVALQWFG